MEFNATVFILQWLTFIVGMILSWIIFIPYLKGWMQARQKRIEDQITSAEKREKESEALKADLEKRIKDLERRTSETLQQAKAEAGRMKDEIVQTSRKEAERILGDARKALENERQAVTATLQQEVGALAVSIAEKIMKSSVDAKVQEKIVQESVRELDARKN